MFLILVVLPFYEMFMLVFRNYIKGIFFCVNIVWVVMFFFVGAVKS